MSMSLNAVTSYAFVNRRCHINQNKCRSESSCRSSEEMSHWECPGAAPITTTHHRFSLPRSSYVVTVTGTIMQLSLTSTHVGVQAMFDLVKDTKYSFHINLIHICESMTVRVEAGVQSDSTIHRYGNLDKHEQIWPKKPSAYSRFA